MKLELFIARRYLLSRKSHHAINIISGISVLGVAMATMALVCTLSVFNGFRDMVAGLFTAFDPDLKIVSSEGTYIHSSDNRLQEILKDKRIRTASWTLEGSALATYGEAQAIITLKGVDDNFIELSDLGNCLYGDGVYQLTADIINYGILGYGLTYELGIGARFEDPLTVYAPRRKGSFNVANPRAGFRQDELNSPGVVFSVQQMKYDGNYILCPLRFARSLFELDDEVSALEIAIADTEDIGKVKSSVSKLLGDEYKVMDRYEQQNDVFHIMEIEKLLSYIFLSFILVVACLNIVGSLSMLILDKKADVITLRNLGASDKMIGRIFLLEGWLISASGAVAGLLLGLFICWLQQTFGILRLGPASGSFIVDAYPVSVHFSDLLVILVTVVVIGWLSVLYPVRYLTRRLL